VAALGIGELGGCLERHFAGAAISSKIKNKSKNLNKLSRNYKFSSCFVLNL